MVTVPEGRAGTCFGYEVRVDWRLQYLRTCGAGEEVLHVDRADLADSGGHVLLRRWEPPVTPFRATLYGGGGVYRLYIDQAGWFGIDASARHVTVPVAGDDVRLEERLWGLPALLCFLHRGDLPLHAVSFEVDGEAVVVGGLGRRGKTTLAAACTAAGLRVLSEDLSCVRMGPAPAVVPGPAMLRVRRDVARRVVPLAGTHEVGRDDERVHLSLDGELRGGGHPLPLRTIVILGEESDELSLTPIDGSRALHLLWPLSFNLPTAHDRGRSFAQLAELSTRTPVQLLRRPMTFDALPDVVEVLAHRRAANV